MKSLVIATLALIIGVPACAVANDAIDSALKEKGAIKTASGMVYVPVKEGSGPSPKAESMVGVDYRGTLTNGVVFDSSYRSKMIVKFRLTDVIACWQEGMQLMKAGGKAKFVCPPELAYGSRGAGSDIPPNSTLLFDVELLTVE